MFAVLSVVVIVLFAQCVVTAGVDCKTCTNCFAQCAGNFNKLVCDNHTSVWSAPEQIPSGDDTVGRFLNMHMKWAVPGMDHINQGFDIVRGAETSHPVIGHRYCLDSPDTNKFINYVYRGNTYLIPSAVHYVGKPQCSVEAQSTLHSYASSIAQSKFKSSQASISANAHVNVGEFLSASAKASYSQDDSVKEASKMSSSSKTSVATTSFSCTVSYFEWAEELDSKFGVKYLHPDFERELNEMKTVEDATKLVKRYGTHIYKTASLGGKLEMLTVISDSLLESHSETAITSKIAKDASAEISGGFGAVSGGGGVDVSFNEEGSQESVEDSSMAENSQSSSIKSFGGAPFNPGSSNWDSWATTIDALPVPIEYTLAEIADILPLGLNKHNQSIRELWISGVIAYVMEQEPSYLSHEYYLYVNMKHNTTLGYFGLNGANCDHTCYDKGFGPFAYRFRNTQTGESLAPWLMTIPGTSSARFFVNNNDVYEVNVPVKGSIKINVDAIEVWSYSRYLNTYGTISQKNYWKIDKYTTSTVDDWLVDSINFFDASQGKQYLFYPNRMFPAVFAGPNIYSDWNEDFGTFLKVNRWYLQLELYGTPKSVDSRVFGSTDGQISITIYASKRSVVWQFPLTNGFAYGLYAYNKVSRFVLQLSRDIGKVRAVSISVFASENLYYIINKARVVDMYDNVYVSNLRSPIALIQKSGPRTIEDIIKDNVNPRNLSTTAYIPVSPWTDTKYPTMIYLYQLLFNGGYTNMDTAYNMCRKLGATQPVNELFNRLISTNQIDWCHRTWVFTSYDYYSIFDYLPYSEKGSTCYTPRSTLSSCGNIGLNAQRNSGPCAIACVGPSPNIDLLEQNNLTLASAIIPVRVSGFEDESLPNAIDPNTYNVPTVAPTPAPTTTPTPAPTTTPSPTPTQSTNSTNSTNPPPQCAATVQLVQTGNSWLTNGMTTSQYFLTFTNVGEFAITSIVVDLPTAEIANTANLVFINANHYSPILSTSMEPGAQKSSEHSFQGYGNSIYATINSVACN